MKKIIWKVIKIEMATQVSKSEQINSYMQMVIDYDQPLTKEKDFLRVYKKALGENVSIFKYDEL